MQEEISINIDGHRDKVGEITETSDQVIINYIVGDQTRQIVIPREYIDYVKDVIDGMELGERYSSKYVYNKCILQFKIKSKIIEDRLPILKEVLEKNGLNEMKIKNIFNELEKNDEYTLSTFDEIIGIRDTKTSEYFRFYGCIRYWAEKGIIYYNTKGSIMRIG